MQSKTETIKNVKGNYYVSSFSWSMFQNILSAIIGFISTPLLLKYYGKTSFGILSIATACNGYMYLLDLGMNTGAVKFFSKWQTEGKMDLLKRVAGTNIAFYGFISLINIIGLVILALCGEHLFSVTHENFLLLRKCLLILAIFNLFSWYSSTFNQLLISSMQITFTMKVQSIINISKGLLIVAVFLFELTLQQYFFIFTLLVSLTVVPYVIRCKKSGLINSILPKFYWQDFKPVIVFSLSIFALSLFQMTATQSRPIILSIFSNDGAKEVADFRIIETIPTFIIMICGTFTGIFLPKVSEMIAKNSNEEISAFAYKWTKNTTIITNILTIPFILCAQEILAAYVGEEYRYLSVWMIIWCLTVLVQMHTTPGNALVLGYGKTKQLVVTTSISCCISIVINIVLTNHYGVGSAILAYFIYVLIVIGLYYLYYYKKLLNLSRIKMFFTFFKPTSIALLLFVVIKLIPSFGIETDGSRLPYLYICLIKSTLWLIPYVLLLLAFKIIDIRDFYKQ
ncbi:MAG: polysaccharide biosynthesis C-terminal domain-containing protein [Bacteroidales bacterium]|nr:polysaccharide biosynthesis C-terminal domain-containing protein [Bacteroidales bacterium]